MIRPEGAAAAGDALDEIADAIRHNLTAALAAEADALAAEAKRRCPVDTGKLRNSIRTTVRTQDDTTEVTVGSSVDYAAAVELGTLHQPPTPYLMPALRARRAAISERVQQAVRCALQKETE